MSKIKLIEPKLISIWKVIISLKIYFDENLAQIFVTYLSKNICSLYYLGWTVVNTYQNALYELNRFVHPFNIQFMH